MFRVEGARLGRRGTKVSGVVLLALWFLSSILLSILLLAFVSVTQLVSARLIFVGGAVLFGCLPQVLHPSPHSVSIVLAALNTVATVLRIR